MVKVNQVNKMNINKGFKCVEDITFIQYLPPQLELGLGIFLTNSFCKMK